MPARLSLTKAQRYALLVLPDTEEAFVRHYSLILHPWERMHAALQMPRQLERQDVVADWQSRKRQMRPPGLELLLDRDTRTSHGARYGKSAQCLGCTKPRNHQPAFRLSVISGCIRLVPPTVGIGGTA